MCLPRPRGWQRGSGRVRSPTNSLHGAVVVVGHYFGRRPAWRDGGGVARHESVRPGETSRRRQARSRLAFARARVRGVRGRGALPGPVRGGGSRRVVGGVPQGAPPVRVDVRRSDDQPLDRDGLSRDQRMRGRARRVSGRRGRDLARWRGDDVLLRQEARAHPTRLPKVRRPPEGPAIPRGVASPSSSASDARREKSTVAPRGRPPPPEPRRPHRHAS